MGTIRKNHCKPKSDCSFRSRLILVALFDQAAVQIFNVVHCTRVYVVPII